jgi:hypothetical protein
MADEIVHDAPEAGAEVTDLRSTIMAAVEKQRAPEPEADGDEIQPIEAKTTSKPVDKPGDGHETEAERNQRLRDDKGKFATEKNAVKTEPKPEKVSDAPPAEAPAPEDGKPALRPPPGWSPTAKVAFDKLPPEVKQAVANREEEINKGFAKFQEYKPIDRYMEMARQSGTTLDKALENYVGIEAQLAKDFTAGISGLCQRQGVHPVALAQAILARHGVAPSNGAAGETPEVRQPAPSVDLSPVMQKITALESYIQQQDNQAVQTELQRFASDPKHAFYENVRAVMGRLINSGQAETLEDAYDQACWANKEIRELLIKQQAAPQPSAQAADAVQRAKAAAKATGGAPAAGFRPNPGTEGAPLRETIVAAVRAQRGI